MNINKQDIFKSLETITIAGGQNIVENGEVQNVVTFADEVIVDLVLSTPALHIKKKAEADIIKAIKENVFAEAKVLVNIKVEAPATPEPKNNLQIWYSLFLESR